MLNVDPDLHLRSYTGPNNTIGEIKNGSKGKNADPDLRAKKEDP